MPAKKPTGLVAAAASGDRREALLALRDELARRLVDADRDAAPLARQLTIVLREIEQLPVPGEKSRVDDLAKRRARRRAASDRDVAEGSK
ncbi:MAG: hypothetical protein KGR21_09680 [Proteobacteria bacterium]|nr:hypothetical protein [Pseudomonadota bacterium]